MGTQNRNHQKNIGRDNWQLKFKAINKNGLEIAQNETINQ